MFHNSTIFYHLNYFRYFGPILKKCSEFIPKVTPENEKGNDEGHIKGCMYPERKRLKKFKIIG